MVVDSYDVGELLEAVDTPVFEKSAGLLRLQLRAQKERAESLRIAAVAPFWVTVQPKVTEN
ncbi:unnamed protein product [Cladocopium goreaui]|uniref:Uncharacterized protein n=1 Tax=Cladocopium goreaui TaxID=2562237 RepID=A0A9P1C7Q9_9DINO|nr:unnamed protein product [Cladocopium goreaui]